MTCHGMRTFACHAKAVKVRSISALEIAEVVQGRVASISVLEIAEVVQGRSPSSRSQRSCLRSGASCVDAWYGMVTGFSLVRPRRMSGPGTPTRVDLHPEVVRGELAMTISSLEIAEVEVVIGDRPSVSVAP